MSRQWRTLFDIPKQPSDNDLMDAGKAAGCDAYHVRGDPWASERLPASTVAQLRRLSRLGEERGQMAVRSCRATDRFDRGRITQYLKKAVKRIAWIDGFQICDQRDD